MKPKPRKPCPRCNATHPCRKHRAEMDAAFRAVHLAKTRKEKPTP